MKHYRIMYGDTVLPKDLKKIDPTILGKIKKNIEDKLSTKPDIFGKPLRKSLKGYRRLRIGPYRVLFKIVKQEVRIVFIGKKPKVYNEFIKRLKG